MNARADMEAQWRARVETVLKGAPFEKLIAHSADGIAIGPLYDRLREDKPRALRQKPGDWRVLTRIDHPDAEAANAQALIDLENGASGLALVFAGASSAHGFGVSVDEAAIAALLQDIHLDAGIRLEVDVGSRGARFALAFADQIARQKVEPVATEIGFGLDPLDASAIDVAQELMARGFAREIFAADGRAIHAAGGTEAQELAYALGAAVVALRSLEGVGVHLDAARAMIGFRLAADADQFLTLAKFRAMRQVWARVEESCGLAPRATHVHAETAWRMMARRDPHVNLLRATVATFSAGLGGADCCVVTPFTQALGLPDPFARRIARNTQLVLLEESHLGFVADPAAGAGGFEALTQELCERAWNLFQNMEGSGGLAPALASGSFINDVASARASRQREVAIRNLPLTGVSEYPDLYEDEPAVLAPMPAHSFADGAPLTPMRDAEPFEALRDESDRRAARDRRPKVFLASLGPASAFTARATFAKAFFEAGGIVALSNDGSDDPQRLAEVFRSSGATLACLCSSDAVYAERAVAAAGALRQAGARRIYLAGRPGALQDALKAAGVEEFIFSGADMLAVLQRALMFCD